MNIACLRSMRLLTAGVLLCGMLAGGGCASHLTLSANSDQSIPVIATGKVLTFADVKIMAPGAILGDAYYAEVNSAWLRVWYATFRAELFRIGVVKWDQRFDCNQFASFYTSMAQAYFSREMFQSRSKAQALALGSFWYERANGGKHAIVQAITERGRIFIDPQTGSEVQLSPAEAKSAYVQVF